jgi:hypothetical protein
MKNRELFHFVKIPKEFPENKKENARASFVYLVLTEAIFLI